MKRILSLVLVMCILSSLIVVLPINVAAGTYGFYTYNISNREATITKCDRSIWGAITIPETLGGFPVTRIEESAFSFCRSLESVIIPNSVTSIGESAFSYCERLERIAIPDSVTRIGLGAFSNTAYYNDSSNWINGVLYMGNHLIEADNSISGEYVIKSGTIGIGDYAFYGCEGLTKITIPDSLVSIGSYTFWGCTGITSITIPDSVTSIGGSTFLGCKGLVSVTIPDSVKCIHSLAFSGCTGLTNITIPDGVTRIGRHAFNDCTNLINITISDGVTSIEEYAFSDTAYYNDSSNWINGVLYMGNHLIEADNSISGEYVIKSGTRCIGDAAFCGCNDLTSITIPDSVTSIGTNAFCGCDGITSITIPDSVMSIGYKAFYSCDNIEEVTIGNSVKSIDNSAFGACTGLEKINWNAKNIADFSYKNEIFTNAGQDGDGIEVVFGDNVEHIPAYAFYPHSNSSCTPYIRSVTISNSVTSISDSAFEGCNGLTDITIPDTITSIGDSAFRECISLTSITIGSGVTSIGSAAFYGCIGLTNIIIPDSIKYLEDYVFSGCSNLKRIEIPKSVENIYNWAFRSCENLSDIYYSGSKEDWNNINISPIGDDCLLNATIHFNYKPEITELSVENKNKSADIKISVINTNDNATVYVASYDENGVLLEIQELILTDGQASGTFGVTDVEKFKAFVWRGNKPLAEAKECEL